jgi:septal ring factor EnvC (AmiA/AmiB activator)
METARERNSPFLSELARFETSLETPVVPGELPNWVASVRKSCEALGALQSKEIQEAHAQQLEEISEEDVALAPRIEAIKSKDEELVIQRDELESQLRTLSNQAKRAEPNEATLDDRIAEITAQGLKFVIDSRKQDTSLTTWHAEAFNRDRGVGD